MDHSADSDPTRPSQEFWTATGTDPGPELVPALDDLDDDVAGDDW